MEVNAQTAHLDTGVDAVTVDWQVDRFIKTTGSVWDRLDEIFLLENHKEHIQIRNSMQS